MGKAIVVQTPPLHPNPNPKLNPNPNNVLKKKADDIVAAYHAALKDVIVEKVHFEIKQLGTETIKTVVRSVYRLIDVFACGFSCHERRRPC